MPRAPRPALFFATVCCAIVAFGAPRAAQSRPAQAGAFLWVEGEDAASTTFNRHNWYSTDGVRADLLSPGTPGGQVGAWLAHYDTGGRTATATYAVNVTEAGRYTLWLRASAYQVRMWYQVDGGAHTDIDTDSDPREYMNLLVSGRIDIRFLAWFKVSALDLTAGTHQLTFGVAGNPARNGGQEVHGGIDAICLVDFPWAPAGDLKPALGVQFEPDPDAWFPLHTDDDPFSPESVTDMSALVPRPAGRHGVVMHEGADLRFADGTLVKFWGVNASPAATAALQTQQARYYAKNGISLVRLHPVEGLVGLLEPAPGGGRRLNADRLDHLDHWFATLKDQGIYSDWSVFYPHVITPDDGYPADLYAELPASGGGKSTSGYVNFMRPLQDAEWAWLHVLMDHVNPYTGLRYADDPALAVVEVHNEDSVFWHFPLNVLEAGKDAPRHTAELQRLWQMWLRGRYANDAALLAAWGPAGRGSRAGDSLANAKMAVYGAWEMGADGPTQNKAEQRRMGDFIRFLAETQRDYFTRRGDELRGIGYQGLRTTTAWQAGGEAARLANLWTDDSLDIIDRHNYFGGGAGEWRIDVGAVNNGTHLAQPGSGILDRAFEQVADKPFMMTEWSQSPPNQWKAEIAPLFAFYGMGLHGWDASMHFAASLPRMGSGWPEMDSYVSETPHYIGQFPALAFAIQHGHVAQGDVVAARRVAVDDAFRGVDALTQNTPSGGWGAGATGGPLTTPLETFAMGRVTAKVADGLPRSERADWDRLWDHGTGVVQSTTGELTWDSQNRFVTVRTNRTQGIIGFAGGRTLDLGAVAVTLRTSFVSLLFTPLDDQPLATSARILITAMARDQQTGARYNADGTQLEALGGPPLLMEPVQADITFKGAPLLSAQAVDIHGVPTGREIERSANVVHIDGRYATYYYLVTTAGAGTATATPTLPTPASPTPPLPTVPPVAHGHAYLPWASSGH